MYLKQHHTINGQKLYRENAEKILEHENKTDGFLK